MMYILHALSNNRVMGYNPHDVAHTTNVACIPGTMLRMHTYVHVHCCIVNMVNNYALW